MVALQEVTAKFSGHETFTLRYGWLTKAVAAVKCDPEIFSREDAMVTLGVGKNMVRSIRHWSTSLGIVEEDDTVQNHRGRYLRVSNLGKRIFAEDGLDPYLENVSTLWLLHWQLASRPDSPTTWYWSFNQFPHLEFSVDQLVVELLRIAAESPQSRASETTIRRDVNCFIRTYIPAQRSRTVAIEDTLDCPFSELGLLRETGEANTVAFARGDHPTLSTTVFAFALLSFWESRDPDLSTLSFADVAYEPGGPGRVFKLSETAVSAHLHRIHKVPRTGMRFDSTAGLSQVYRHQRHSPMDVLASPRARKRR